MPPVFNAFYLAIFIASLRKIFRKAVPMANTDMDRKFIVAIPYGEHYVCGTFITQDRARRLAQKIEKLTNYHLDYDLTVEQYRLQHIGDTVSSIFESNSTYIMPPDTPEIRRMCLEEGQDLRSTTI